MRIDCHGHVWTDDPATYPYAEGRGAPPSPTDTLGTAEVLLEGMSEAEVDGFMIVQPIFHGFDHSYVRPESGGVCRTQTWCMRRTQNTRRTIMWHMGDGCRPANR